MSDVTIVRIDEVQALERRGGVKTWPLIAREHAENAAFTTGMTVFPKGEGASLHRHNCDEQVTLLAGEGMAEVEGETFRLKQYDTTYVAADKEHRFWNTGDQPMRILWIYSSNQVTRTFSDSGETVPHLSPAGMS